ncbi:MAG: hypothetical protein QF893_07860 [Alphaproteobacteria bacterium]|jgi:hypothetical protein|nr:hypothetical protein [Alphaproteobacteria bacterium]
MTVELMNPCGEFTHEEVPLSPRPGLAEGTTVGLFNNSKKNADTLLDDVADLLSERHGGLKFIRFGKEASLPADFSAGFLDECDVVVAALAD